MGFQMKGDPLPGKDHISRYCAPKTAPDGQPTGASFMLRKDEDFLEDLLIAELIAETESLSLCHKDSQSHLGLPQIDLLVTMAFISSLTMPPPAVLWLQPALPLDTQMPKSYVSVYK
jgi:hypothetical protein